MLLTILILINLRDEQLTPAAQVLLREPTYLVPDAENGFFILRAINADASLDAFETGKKIVQVEEKIFRTDPHSFDQKHTPDSYKLDLTVKWDTKRCGELKQSCVESDLLNRVQLKKQIKANAVLTERYARMQTMTGYEEHILPTPDAPLPPLAALVKASDMAVVNAAFEIADGKFQQGITSLQANNRYVRLVASNSSLLITKMVCLAILRKQTSVVSELIRLYPQFYKDHGDAISEILRPFKKNELDFPKTLAHEASITNFILDINFNKEVESTYSYYLGKLFYQRNATINQMALMWQQRIAISGKPPSSYTKIHQNLELADKKRSEQSWFSYWQYSYNPAGKIICYVAESNNYLEYLEKATDTDAYLRLVGLQFQLSRNKIEDSNIADFVAKAPEPFRSPYDSSAMIWNAKDRQLEFIGRQDTSSNLNHGKRFIVPLG